MGRFAVAFDISTLAMRADLVERQGLTHEAYRAELSNLYRRDIPAALAACGTIRRKQRSLYHLDSEFGLEETIEALIHAAADHAPHLCRYVTNITIYPVGRGHDLTRRLNAHG